MYDNDEFIRLFIEYRKQLGISIEKMAVLMSEDTRIIENIEYGYSKPVTRFVINFLNLLDKDIKELMLETEKVQNDKIYKNVINSCLIDMNRDKVQLIFDILKICFELGDEK